MENHQNKITQAYNKLNWYAMRVTYSREIAFKEYLDAREIKNFIPMCYEESSCGCRKFRKLVPVVHNLVFVRSSRKLIDSIKRELDYRVPVRYIMDQETNTPIIVPEKQMKDFIAVAGTYDEQLIWLEEKHISCKKGDRVRITGGLLKGVEGILMRIRGDRRVVVSIQGFMAVATAFIHPALLERINTEEEKIMLENNSKKIDYAKGIF